jgi:hypothetical protein
MDKISLEVLDECLSPVPRNFENLSVTKLSKTFRDGKYYVGYETYVMLESAENMNPNIHHERGTCIIVPIENEDEYYMDDLVDTVETEISIEPMNWEN